MMFHHVVLMRLTDVDETFHAAVDAFVREVRRELPYVRRYAYVANTADRRGPYGYAVLASFDDAGEHDRYQVSDVHQRMRTFMLPHIVEIAVCDADDGIAP